MLDGRYVRYVRFLKLAPGRSCVGLRSRVPRLFRGWRVLARAWSFQELREAVVGLTGYAEGFLLARRVAEGLMRQVLHRDSADRVDGLLPRQEYLDRGLGRFGIRS